MNTQDKIKNAINGVQQSSIEKILYSDCLAEPIFVGKCINGVSIDGFLSHIKKQSTLSDDDLMIFIESMISICEENGWNDFSEFMD